MDDDRVVDGAVAVAYLPEVSAAGAASAFLALSVPSPGFLVAHVVCEKLCAVYYLCAGNDWQKSAGDFMCLICRRKRLPAGAFSKSQVGESAHAAA